MIEVFGFNTTNSGVFEMHNTTVEEIKAEMHKRFPKWSDAVIDKMVNNKSFYKEVIPYDKDESDSKKHKKVKRGSIAKESICINGFELNPILNLGQSIHCYQKYAYRYWGTEPEKLLNQPNVSAKYEKFETAFDGVVVAVKNKPISKQTITSKVIEMCDKMDDLKNAIEKTGVLKQDWDKDYVKSNGRKLGLCELMSRVSELGGDCTEALK